MQEVHFIKEGIKFSFEKTVRFLLKEINLRELSGEFNPDEILACLGDRKVDRIFANQGSMVNLTVDSDVHEKFIFSYQSAVDSFKVHFETDSEFPAGTISLQASNMNAPICKSIWEWIEKVSYKKAVDFDDPEVIARQQKKREEADAKFQQELFLQRQKQKEAAREKKRKENGCLCKHEHIRVDARSRDRSFYNDFIVGKSNLLQAVGHYYSASIYQCKNCQLFFSFEEIIEERGRMEFIVRPVTSNQAELLLAQADSIKEEVKKDSRRFVQILTESGLELKEKAPIKEEVFDYKTKCKCSEYGRFKKHNLDYYSRKRETLLMISHYNELRIDLCKICGTCFQEFGTYGRYGVESRVITLLTPNEIEFVKENAVQMRRDKESLLGSSLEAYIRRSSK